MKKITIIMLLVVGLLLLITKGGQLMSIINPEGLQDEWRFTEIDTFTKDFICAKNATREIAPGVIERHCSNMYKNTDKWSIAYDGGTCSAKVSYPQIA